MHPPLVFCGKSEPVHNQQRKAMTAEEVFQQLESLGSEQTRKTYRRHGVLGEMYGVSYANLGALAKKLKRNHPLALALWQSGNHDARMLATMIADPAQLDGKILDTWVADLDSAPLTDAFAKIADDAPDGTKKSAKWRKSKEEWVSSAGWFITAQQAGNPAVADDSLAALLPIIEATIHKAKNRTRYAMNTALISIGLRPGLRQQAIATARAIGKVEVDHGQTSCKTPDAESYILKTVEHREKSRPQQ
ncbi:MAG: DNA alkylation repair enzyme [Chlorobi bacterium OLB7]|nr:MAG: DNA alkylation repair enzyme [Chlorobi bacterium OLB7]